MSGLWLLSYLALWFLVLFLGTLVFVLFHELGVRVLHTSEGSSRDGIAVGSDAPLRPQLPTLSPGRMTLLVFGSASCGPCRSLVPDLNKFARREARRLDTFFVTTETAEGADLTRREMGIEVTTIGDRAAASEFGVRVTPFGFILNDQGVVLAKGLVNHEGGLRWIFEQALVAAARPAAALEAVSTSAR